MTTLQARDREPEWNVDQRVRLHRVPWSVYEGLLEARGDSAGVRISYLRGEMELMTPSPSHEHFKKSIARLLEAWAIFESGVDLAGYGSWTQKDPVRQIGVEPDECYVLGDHPPKRPDLVLEVNWTSGGIDKLELYRGFKIPEVWIWEDGRLQIHVLRRGRYVEASSSAVLPSLDVEQLVCFAKQPKQAAAVRAYLAELRSGRGRSR